MTATKETILPPRSETIDKIYAYQKAKGDAEPKRGYLGASIIGEECERYLWYNFRQATKESIEGRIYRLFETGDLEEIRIVAELRAIGCTVHATDPNTHEQFAVFGFGGHFSGHMDAAILGLPESPKTWHVGEFKTHNDKSFRDLEKKGVRVSKPKHYAQMQCYMGLTGMKRAIYIAVDKNTDEMYGERIKYDHAFFEQLMERAHRIITSTNIPPRISDRPDWYACRFCSAKEICHATSLESEALATKSRSCRQCCFATPDTKSEGARWVCSKLGKALSAEDQDRTCERLLYLPGMFNGHSDPVGYGVDDAGIDYIDYETREPDSGGRIRWRQGGGGGWGGEEVCCVSVSTLGNPLVRSARERGSTVSHHESKGNCIARYSDMETCFCSWAGHASELKSGWRELYGTDIPNLTPLDQDENLQCIGIEYQAKEGVKACAVVDIGCMKAFIMEEKS